MNTFRKITIIFLLASLLVGCAPQAIAPVNGDVLAVNPGTVLTGLQYALNGGSGSVMLTKMTDTKYMIVWARSIEDGWMFWGVDMASQSPIDLLEQVFRGGNFINARTMGDLVSYLQKDGWEVLPAAEAPMALKMAASSGNTWLSIMSGHFVPVLVPMQPFVQIPDELLRVLPQEVNN